MAISALGSVVRVQRDSTVQRELVSPYLVLQDPTLTGHRPNKCSHQLIEYNIHEGI